MNIVAQKQSEIGYNLEKKILQLIGATSISPKTGVMDGFTSTEAIEVKSCQLFKKNGRDLRNGEIRQRSCRGEFLIYQQPHKELKKEAEVKNLIPMYIFIIHSGNSEKILKIFKAPWNFVELFNNNREQFKIAVNFVLFTEDITDKLFGGK